MTHTIPRRRRHPGRLPLPPRVLLLVLLSTLTACQEDEILPSAPGTPGIRGHVLTAGDPTPATVTVERVGSPGGFRSLVVERSTDSQGGFDFVLPAGRYRADVRFAANEPFSAPGRWYYRRSGLTSRSADAETLIVAESGPPVAIDFRRGRLEVELNLPPDLLGPRLYLRAERAAMDEGGGWRERARWWGSVGRNPARMELPAVPGIYRLYLTSDGRGDAIWLPGVSNESLAESIRVAADETAVVRATLSDGPAILRILLLGGGFERVGPRGVSILAFDADSALAAGANLDVGAYGDIVGSFARQVRLSVDGMFWVGGPGFAEAPWFEMSPGNIVVVPTITAGAIRLRWQGPQAIERKNTRIRFQTEDGAVLPARRLAFDGDVASIDVIPPGRYRLRVEPERPGWDSWVSQWFDRAERPEDATLIEIPEDGSNVPVLLRVEAGGAIRGTVVAPNYAVSVYGTRPDDPRACWIGQADPRAGRFALVGLENGDYKVGLGSSPCCAGECPMPPASTRWYGGASWDSAAVVTIREHGTVEGIELVWR